MENKKVLYVEISTDTLFYLKNAMPSGFNKAFNKGYLDNVVLVDTELEFNTLKIVFKDGTFEKIPMFNIGN